MTGKIFYHICGVMLMESGITANYRIPPICDPYCNYGKIWVFICTMHLNVCSYHVIYAFQSESTLYNCLNVKSLFAQNRSLIVIWSLSDCNSTQTWNYFLTKWLSVRLQNKRLWVQVQLQSLKLQIQYLFRVRVPWHSFNYRGWIHSKTRMWHDKNIYAVS